MWLGTSAHQAPLGCRPLLPLPQVLGLLGRHRDRPVLSRGGAAEYLLGRAAVPAQGRWRRGGIYGGSFQEKREVPDTFHLMAEYAEGPLAGAQFLDGELAAHPRPDPRARRHHHHGGPRPVRARNGPHHGEAAKWSASAIAKAKKSSRKLVNPDYNSGWKRSKIPVDQTDMMESHIEQLPAVHAHPRKTAPGCRDWREGRSGHQPGGAVVSRRQAMYWDEKHWKASDKPVRA